MFGLDKIGLDLRIGSKLGITSGIGVLLVAAIVVSQMLGSSQMIVGQRTQDYTYMRIESRPDGLYYVAVPSGKKEITFKLAGVEDEKGVKVFTFSSPQDEFPQRIVYRHNEQGSMFAQVGGKVDGKDKEVTYPMHRVDCVTGAIPRD